tara:strand:+ start:258 stop:1175 length:918 start_codon:yes stop_codon:yes gene_type:complete
MFLTKYKIYYKGKLYHEVHAADRQEAAKKAKYWFYKQVGKGKLDGKARIVLMINDPNKEGKFTPDFNVQLAKNNFFLKEDADRIIKQSNGTLRYSTKKEIEKASQKSGGITQFTRTKRHRVFPKKVKGIPYLYKWYDNYYYNITFRSQVTVGTVWRKGGLLNVKSSPRWDGDGRKVWTSKSIKESPACLKKGKKTSEHRSKLLRLESPTEYEALCEILDKRLYEADKSRDLDKKVKKLRDAKLELQLREALSFFPTLSNMQTSAILKDGMKIINNKILYSKHWLRLIVNDEQKLYSSIRKLIRSQ